MTDMKVGIDNNGAWTAEYYEATVVSAVDYYPFGSAMAGRKYNQGTYRFGFNGTEEDSEWGSQMIQDYGFRIYNPTIGKFLSVDPLMNSYPYYTPYQFAGNEPIWAIDLDGLEELVVTINGSWWYDKFFEYWNTQDDNSSALTLLIVGSSMIDKSMVESKTYADNNWGESNSNPISIKTKEGVEEDLSEIKKLVDKHGKLTLHIRARQHTEGGHIIEDGTEMNVTTLVITEYKGLSDNTTGVQKIAGTFVFEYSGFGKMFRWIGHDRDPLTGKKIDGKDKLLLTTGGILDLLTMGSGTTAKEMLVSGGINITLNVIQGVVNDMTNNQLTEVTGLSREAVDVLLAGSQRDWLDVALNLAQAGLITADMFGNEDVKKKIENYKVETKKEDNE